MSDRRRDRLTADAERAEHRVVGESESLRDAIDRRDPFWAPQLVVAGAILLGFVLPNRVTIGPTWLLPSFEALLLLGLVLATPSLRTRHPHVRRYVALALTGLVTLVNIVSIVLLCRYLIHGGKETGRSLIGAGIVLWLTNMMLFGLWYWQLDRGGPLERAHRTGRRPDFLFPQMTDPKWAADDWMPGLIDYMYVSFTNATAFSPTDTMPLTQGAKVLMAGQALTALITIGLVVARAVNILS